MFGVEWLVQKQAFQKLEVNTMTKANATTSTVQNNRRKSITVECSIMPGAIVAAIIGAVVAAGGAGAHGLRETDITVIVPEKMLSGQLADTLRNSGLDDYRITAMFKRALAEPHNTVKSENLFDCELRTIKYNCRGIEFVASAELRGSELTVAAATRTN